MDILARMKKLKNTAAARLGKKGGLARAKKLTKGELSEQGRKAVLARWEKWRKENPTKVADQGGKAEPKGRRK
jgi:hypothetical protein